MKSYKLLVPSKNTILYFQPYLNLPRQLDFYINKRLSINFFLSSFHENLSIVKRLYLNL